MGAVRRRRRRRPGHGLRGALRPRARRRLAADRLGRPAHRPRLRAGRTASSRSTGSPRWRRPRSAATPPSRPAPSGWPSTTRATSWGRSRRRTSTWPRRSRAGEEALATAERAARLMPTFLGDNGKRHYLYVFQNNAEVRSTGGLPGNVSLVRAVDGKVKIIEQSSGAAFGRRETPVLPLTSEEASLYGDQLGTYFLDANFTPDVPRAAELWKARWEELLGGTVDGVFTIDPVTLSYLLDATGPVQVGPVVLTRRQRRRRGGVGGLPQPVPTPSSRTSSSTTSPAEVFDTFAAGTGDQVGAIRALVRGVAEGRVRLHSFDDADQSVVAGTTIAGELAGTDPRRPTVGVYLNDATGSKMSYYLDYEVDVAAVDLRPRPPAAARPDADHLRRPRATRRRLPQAVTGYDGSRASEVARGQQQCRRPRDGARSAARSARSPSTARRSSSPCSTPRRPRRPPLHPPLRPRRDLRPHLADEHRPRPGRRRRHLRHPRPPPPDRVLRRPLRLRRGRGPSSSSNPAPGSSRASDRPPARGR